MSFYGIRSADGLSDEESAIVDECVDVLRKNVSKHEERRAYYLDKVGAKNRGLDVPLEYRGMNCATGWAAKVVNALAERSVFDSFTFDGEPPDGFEDAMERNDVVSAYEMAVPSMLIDGVGFWCACIDEAGELSIHYYDATTASGIYDWKRHRLSAALYVNDFKRFSRGGRLMPSECVLMTGDENVVLRRSKKGGSTAWAVEGRIGHGAGVVTAVPMAFKRTNARPFGRSRITKAAMGYIDRMMEELQNTSIQSDTYSIPMKYVLGASDDQYAALSENMHKAYKAEMLVMTANEDGGTPSVGMLQGADMTPHVAWMDKLANLLAAETSLPVATFGVAGNGYTSSDALRASTDDLVILAKAMNKANAKAMRELALIAMALLRGSRVSDLGDGERSVTAHFLDPSMPSDAANADAMVKVVSAVPEFAGTDVFWEKMGYDEDSRRRIASQTAAARTRDDIKAALFARPAAVGADADSPAGGDGGLAAEAMTTEAADAGAEGMAR